MILFIGDVDRGTRDREAFQEVDFPAMFAPLAKWASADRAMRGASPNMSRAPMPPRWAAARAGGARAPRGHAARRGRGGRSPADRAGRRRRRRRSRWTCSSDAAGHRRSARSRSSAARAGTDDAGAAISPPAPSARASPSPPPSAGRTRSPTTCPVYAGNLGYGPNPKLVARIKAADLLLVSARGSARRRPTATR